MAAASAFSAAYNSKALVPQLDFGWDTYAVKRSRYYTYDTFKNNTAYATINSQASALKLDNNLYKFIRGIYNPVARFNNLMVSYVAGGALDTNSLTMGSLPVVTDNEAIRPALLKLIEWSRWAEFKSLYVEAGTNKGDTFIKLVDDRTRRKVRFELLPPEFIRDVTFDEVGNVKSVMIEYERDEEVDISVLKPGVLGQALGLFSKNTYLYSEKITKEQFETFKDGKPFAYYANVDGALVDSWPNEYGFVPVVHQTDSPAGSGLKFGKNGYYNALPKLNEINDQASIISDKVRQILQPVLFAEGITAQSQIQRSTSIDNPQTRDQMTVLFGPAGSKLSPVVIDLNISAALENLHSMLMEVEKDLPVLALQGIREKGGNLSGIAIENMYGDAIWSVKLRRGRYDAAFVRAAQMGIAIGGYNGYEGFESFNLDSYARGDLQFYIKDRPVIADALSISEHITALGAINNMSAPLQALALKKLDYNEEEIDGVIVATEESTRNAARGFADGLFGSDKNVATINPQISAGQSQQSLLPATVAAYNVT